jgi:dTDP-glucose 4,6-dehydratase
MLLVTGGAGFIGSAVSRLAHLQGRPVTVLDRLTYAGDPVRLEGLPIPLLPVDITDKAAVTRTFAELRPDAVLHCAAETHVDRSIADSTPFIRTNVAGTQILLDVARRFAVGRFLNVSTDEVYGPHTPGKGQNPGFTTDAPLAPRSPYAASKAAADMLGRAAWHTFDQDVITVRPCNVYGPWQFPEKLIPVATLLAFEGRPVPLYGNGLQRREWLYVEDCACALLRALDSASPGAVLNLGSNEERPNREVVAHILENLGRPPSLVTRVPDRPGHDFRYGLDSTATRTALAWQPEVRFEEGLARTVAWYRQNDAWARPRLVTWERFRAMTP